MQILSAMLLHMPVSVRSLSLSVIAIVAMVYALAWAKAIVVPVLLGLMTSYALTPIVDRLAHWRVPRTAGAGLVISTIVIAFLWGGWSLRNETSSFIDTLPTLTQRLRQVIQSPGTTSVGTIAKVQRAATEISNTTSFTLSKVTLGNLPVGVCNDPTFYRSSLRDILDL